MSGVTRLFNRIPEGLKVHGLLFSMSIIYGIFFPVLKVFAQEVGGIEVAILRQLGFGLVIIVMGWAWNVWHNLPCWKPNFKRDWPSFVAVAFFGVFWMQTLSAVAMGFTTSFHATLCMATIPLQTAIINHILKIDSLTWQRIVGIILGTLGIAWLVVSQVSDAAQGLNAGSNPLLGNGIILLNAFFFASYNVIVKRLVHEYKPIDILSWNFLQAAFLTILLMAFMPPVGGITIPDLRKTIDVIAHLSPLGWGLWAYVTLIAGFVGYLVHHTGLAKTSSNNVAAYTFVQPVVAAIVGIVFLNEHFTLEMGLAALLTFAGMTIASVKRASQFPRT
jgi:drug/metabolite transporter (DMT)-like permease